MRLAIVSGVELAVGSQLDCPRRSCVYWSDLHTFAFISVVHLLLETLRTLELPLASKYFTDLNSHGISLVVIVFHRL